MIGRIKRSTRIAASYASTLGDLVALEAREEVQRLTDRIKQKIGALVLVAFGFVWLNIGVLVLILDSPYRHWMPFAIGLGAALIALIVWFNSRASKAERPFDGVRRALAEDAKLWNIDLSPGHVLADFEASLDPEAAQRKAAEAVRRQAQQAGLTPEQAQAAVDAVQKVVDEMPADEKRPTQEELETQLRQLRLALKQAVTTPGPRRGFFGFGGPRNAPPRARATAAGADATPSGGAGQRFHPKSRTMQTVMALIGQDGDGGAVGQWPARVIGALIVSGVLKRKGRWLIGAWPVIRFVIKMLSEQQRQRHAAAWPPSTSGVGRTANDTTQSYQAGRPASSPPRDAQPPGSAGGPASQRFTPPQPPL